MRIWCVLIQSLKSAPLGCKVIQCSKQCYSVAHGSVFLLIWDLSIGLLQFAPAVCHCWVVSVSDLWQSLIRQTLATTLVSLHTSFIVPPVHWSWTCLLWPLKVCLTGNMLQLPDPLWFRVGALWLEACLCRRGCHFIPVLTSLVPACSYSTVQ